MTQSKLQAASGNISSSESDNGDQNKHTLDKSIERHKRAFKNESIAAPYSNNPMHISDKVKVAWDNENMPCICSYTGIAITLNVPRIKGYAFEYQNPLSIYANVKGMITQGPDYLRLLDTQLLAGIFITAYRHYDLLEAYSPKAKTSSAAMNAMLRSAGKDILVEALDFLNLVNSRNAHRLPAMSLDYQAHMHAVNMAPAIKEYIKLLRGILYPEHIPAKDKALIHTVSEEGIAISNRNSGLSSDGILERRGTGTIKVYSGKNKRATDVVEDAFEERFKKNRKQAKSLLSDIEAQGFSAKFMHALDAVLSSRNLILLSSTLREKIIARLEEKPSPATIEMIRIVRESEDTTDIFGNVDAAFEDAPSTAEAVTSTISAPANTSVADRLAAIKAKIAAKAKG